MELAVAQRQQKFALDICEIGDLFGVLIGTGDRLPHRDLIPDRAQQCTGPTVANHENGVAIPLYFIKQVGDVSSEIPR